MAIDYFAATEAAHDRMFADPNFFDSIFNEHCGRIRDFLATVGQRYTGGKVLDVGCGSGAIDLGMSFLEQCAVVGVDIFPTRKQALLDAAQRAGYADAVKKADLTFLKGGLNSIPASDNEFDHAFSTCVFEHVSDPIGLLREVFRVLKPNGTFYMQLWPLWKSDWGTHLTDHNEPWAHLHMSREDFVNHTGGQESHFACYDDCSRVEVDGLQRAYLASGFHPLKIEFQTGSFSPPLQSQHISWLDLGIAGITVFARKPPS